MVSRRDPTTGRFAAPEVLSDWSTGYGAAFAPDGRYLVARLVDESPPQIHVVFNLDERLRAITR